jgi:hypothetical protein
MATPCPVCKPDPPRRHVGPGVPVEMPGTYHRRDCPTVWRRTAAEQQEWSEWIDEHRRCMARAYAASITAVIG